MSTHAQGPNRETAFSRHSRVSGNPQAGTTAIWESICLPNAGNLETCDTHFGTVPDVTSAELAGIWRGWGLVRLSLLFLLPQPRQFFPGLLEFG